MLRMNNIKMCLALMALLSLNVNSLRDIDKMNSVFTTIINYLFTGNLLG